MATAENTTLPEREISPQAALRKQRQAIGLCGQCGHEAPKRGRKMCDTCLAGYRRQQSLRRDKLRTLGLCIDCGKRPTTEPAQSCADCLSYKRRRVAGIHARRRALGLCGWCGEDGAIVPNNPRRNKRGKPRPTCQRCYLKIVALRVLGDAKAWTLLAEKWERQDAICPYTGTRLQFGVNASLDHVLPTSRFPELARDINNVEWVHDQINIQKAALTKAEFLSFIRVVFDYAVRE